MNALNERDFFHMKKEDGMNINNIMGYIYRDQYKCPYDENECWLSKKPRVGNFHLKSQKAKDNFQSFKKFKQ